jgi:acyl-CoA thioester hydrolase
MPGTATTRPSVHRQALDLYPFRVEILARYADVDPLWHINNVAIAQYYEEARVSTTRRIMGEARIPTGPDLRLLLARQSIDYLREAGYPGKLTVGVGVLRIGNSSYTLGMAMFQDGRCVSVSDAVLVVADAGGPLRLPEEYRERMQALLLPARPDEA